MSEENGMKYDVGDKPPFKENLICALQQFLAISAATILVPLIVDPTGEYLNMASALIGAGFGTIVYLLFTQFKSPVFLGSSFAFIGPLFMAIGCGFFGLIIGALVACLVYVLIAVIVLAGGIRWINKYLPPIVIGPTVALIGFFLAGTAMTYVMYNEYNAALPTASYNMFAIILGLFAFMVIAYTSVRARSSIRMYPFIVGIAVGYVAALILTGIGMATGIQDLQLIDFSPFEKIGDFNNWIPQLTFVGLLGQDLSAVDMSKIVTIIVAYFVTAFVVFTEHLGDHKNISSILKRNLFADPGLHRTLLGDGVGSFVGAIFGGVPNTTYGESIGCVALSKNASTRTILLTAFICIIVAFIYPIVVFVETLPWCVIGSTCIALYGFISVSGLRMLSGVELMDPRNLYVVAAVFICGLGGLYFDFGGGVVIDSLAPALIVGIITNIVMKNHLMNPELEEA